MTYYTADVIYANGQKLSDHYVDVADGQIVSVAPLKTLPPRAFRDMIAFENAMIVPGFVNTHAHSFQSLLKGFCDDRSFFEWRDEALYKYGNLLTEEDIYNGALFAFGEMLKQGITTVCDFFYINDQKNQNAQAVIQAAQDLGIRVVMARTLYDWDGAPKRFRETVDQAVANTESLMAQYQNDPMVSVVPAPHSLHGASLPLIKAGAQLAEEHHTVFHMHVAEGRYERQQVTEEHGLPPVAFLDQEGLLSHRFVGVHCVWLDDAEVQLMGQSNAMISYNPSSNMFLGDGVTRIADLKRAGVSIGLGTDGGCSNNRASIVDEMRMTSLLQKVVHCDATVTTAEEVLDMGTVNGGKLLNLKVGQLAPGYFADFTVVDLEDLSMQPRQNAIKNLVYAMQPTAVQAVYVHGRKVFEMNDILTMSESTIVQRVQTTTAAWG